MPAAFLPQSSIISLIRGTIFWRVLWRAVAADTAIDAYDTAIALVAMGNCTSRCTMGHACGPKLLRMNECVNEDAIYNNEDNDYEKNMIDIVFGGFDLFF